MHSLVASSFERAPALLPGAHLALLANSTDAGIEGRRLGLELRDTLLVVRSGPTTGFVFLFRVPLTEETLVDQVLKTGTGALHTDACRVASSSPNPSIARRETSRRTGVAPLTGRTAKEATSFGRMERRGSAEVYMEYRPSEELGRWPPNVILVHALDCGDVCNARCPVKILSADERYPQLRDEGALFDWLTRLVGVP